MIPDSLPAPEICPERIWRDNDPSLPADHRSTYTEPWPRTAEYIRSDLHTQALARIERLEAALTWIERNHPNGIVLVAKALSTPTQEDGT